MSIMPAKAVYKFPIISLHDIYCERYGKSEYLMGEAWIYSRMMVSIRFFTLLFGFSLPGVSVWKIRLQVARFHLPGLVGGAFFGSPGC